MRAGREGPWRATHPEEVGTAGHDVRVDLVAHRAGFGAGVSQRRHLHAAVGVTPQAYRRTFGRRCPRR